MEAFQQLGQDLVQQIMAQPNVILGAIVAVIMFFLGGKKSKEAVADKARVAIVQAEQNLSKVGQEKLDEALSLVIMMLPAQVKPLAILAKPLLVMIIQKVFDTEFAHFQKGTAAATPVAQPVAVLEAEAEQAKTVLGGSVADTLLNLPERDSQ